MFGLDYGLKRIGVACGDTLSRTARPLGTIENSRRGPRWSELDRLISDWRPSRIIVGLPYNTDGSDSAMTRRAREFAAEVEARYSLAVDAIDERYSSLEAETRLRTRRAAGLSIRRVSKPEVDAAAACIILERWFMQANQKDADAFTAG